MDKQIKPPSIPYRQGFPSHSRVVNLLASFLLLLLLLSASHIHTTCQPLQAKSSGTTQADNDVHTLEPGKPVERELTGGQTHSYRITLAAGQYLHLVVDKRGIDVVATLFNPDGTRLIGSQGQDGKHVQEELSVITKSSGTYRLEVRPKIKDAAAGCYEVRIEERRTATKQDRSRLAAISSIEQTLGEAQRLLAPQFMGGLPGKETAKARQSAIAKLEAALQLSQTTGYRQGEAQALFNIGFYYFGLGEYQKALEYQNRALLLSRTLGYPQLESTILGFIGQLYALSGDKQKAFDHYNQVLRVWESEGEREQVVAALTTIGGFYASLGEVQTAIDYYDQALQLYRAVGDRTDAVGISTRIMEGTLLYAIGMSYYTSGEKQKALEYLNQGFPLLRATNNTGVEASTQISIAYLGLEASTLISIAYLYAAEGEKQKALEFLNQASQLRQKVRNPFLEVLLFGMMGGVYTLLDEKRQALDHYTQLLQLSRKTGNRLYEALAILRVGETYASLGEEQKALEYLNQALPLIRGLGISEIEAAILFSIARFERDRGNLVQARTQIEAALVIIESLRTRITNQELRASFFASKQQLYEFYFDLLMLLHKQRPSEGFDGAALQASERARARSLLELLTEARADIRQGVDPLLLERKRKLQQQLNARAAVQEQLLSSKQTEAQAAAITQELSALTAEIQQVEGQIRAASPRYAALTQPQPLSLKEIQQQVLDPDTLLLEYALGEERSYLWVVTQTSITSYELPKRAEVETAARRFYELLAASRQPHQSATARGGLRLVNPDVQNQDMAEAGTRLSRMLLGPAASQLGKKRLLIVADGALHYVPFAALPSPTDTVNSASPAVSNSHGSRAAAPAHHPASSVPLIVDHEIVSLPSASTLAVLRREIAGRKPAPRAVAVLADPVFDKDDQRLKTIPVNTRINAGGSLAGDLPRRILEHQLEKSAQESGMSDVSRRIPRLPGTRREAESILALIPEAERKQALDFDASRETAANTDLSQYRIIHFATHGFLNSKHPEMSGVVLSLVDKQGAPRDGFLRTFEIFNLNLPADLVVLSACQTGLGKEVKGEGLVGLTRGFMYAGAERVVVSLWSVSDRATEELMVQFYDGMLKRGLRPAAALRAAQVEIWKQKRWEAPYYWAAFVLQGEWR